MFLYYRIYLYIYQIPQIKIKMIDRCLIISTYLQSRQVNS